MRQIDPDWGVMELIKAEIIKDSYVAKKNMKLCEEVLDFLSENEGDYAAIERKFEEADRKKDYDRRNLLRIAVHKLRTSKEIPYAVGEKVRFIGGECEVMRIYTNREEEKKVELKPVGRETSYITCPWAVSLIREEQLDFDFGG